MFNIKDDITTHINCTKGKVEAAYQTILTVMGDQHFQNIEMEIPWKLINSCIIPIITYAGETWHPKKQEEKRRVVINI